MPRKAKPRPIKTCKHPGCGKVLDFRNSSGLCQSHKPQMFQSSTPKPRVADRPDLKTIRVTIPQSDHGTARSPDLGAYRVTLPKTPWE